MSKFNSKLSYYLQKGQLHKAYLIFYHLAIKIKKIYIIKMKLDIFITYLNVTKAKLKRLVFF